MDVVPVYNPTIVILLLGGSCLYWMAVVPVYKPTMVVLLLGGSGLWLDGCGACIKAHYGDSIIGWEVLCWMAAYGGSIISWELLMLDGCGACI